MKALILLALFQQSPADFFGHEMGEDKTLAKYSKVVEYFQHLDEKSDRLELHTLGKSTLGKPFVMAAISTSENLREAKTYQDIARKLSQGKIAEDEAKELAKKGKVIVAITNNIHSTEIGSSQSVAEFAWQCLKKDFDWSNVILLLFPSINPDGQEMIVDWYEKHKGTKWEGGWMPFLYHPYSGHDDNRDWYAMNLVETRMVSKVYYKDWVPQVIVDHHQMGSTGARMWVPPYTNPTNKNVHPMVWRWINVFGTHMANKLEAKGVKGVQAEWIFDSYWPGAADSNVWWHNRIGILTESASCRIATPVWVDPSEARQKQANVMMPNPWKGGWWRLADIVKQQNLSSWSTLETASRHREKILMDSWRMARHQPEKDHEGYFFPARQKDPAALDRLLRILEMAAVEIRKTDDGYYIPLRQATGRYVEDLMGIQTYPDDAKLYDVAGWTLPLQMGVEFTTSEDRKGDVVSTFVPETKPTQAYQGTSSDIAKLINRMHKKGLTVERSEGRVTAPDDESLLKGLRLNGCFATPTTHTVTKPRVGLYQPWITSMDEGWTRLVLDNFEFEYTTLHNKDMKDLKYDCIILPDMKAEYIKDGRDKKSKNKPQELPEEYQGGIGKEGVDALKKFVEEGGTLICFDSASELPISEWGLPVKNTLKDDKAFSCPGSILKVRVDNRHPLGWGMPADAHVYFKNSPAFQTSQPRITSIGRKNVIRYDEEKTSLVSGLLNQPEKLYGKSALVEITMGKGRIVLFGFRPQHRAQSWGTFKLLFNAIHLSTTKKK